MLKTLFLVEISNEMKPLKPESLMMSHGYNPHWSEGAVKPPMFLTSTFIFKSAEEGKAYFELAYGLRQKAQEEQLGLIYSRINNPNLEILENRLALWDKADDCAVFESGMSAISTVLLEFVKPGDLLVYSSPTYGGTDHFIHHVLDQYDIMSVPFTHLDSEEDIIEKIIDSGRSDKLSFIYVETPANPTNHLIDIAMCRRIGDHFATADKQVLMGVDNTYMGPIWSKPLAHGADLCIYSATKYIGGHSDLIAGAVTGRQEVISRVKVLRTFLGNMASPHTCWLLLRSLETLKVRMEAQAAGAAVVADFLINHPKIEKIYYLGNLPQGSKDEQVYQNQYTSAGAMVAFDIFGGEAEAFKFLNELKLIKLAVSLGSTESLAQHPYSMTHAGVDPEDKATLGITDQLVRLSIGIENPEDLVWDIGQALDLVAIPTKA